MPAVLLGRIVGDLLLFSGWIMVFGAIFDKIKKGLAKTRDLFSGVASLFRLRGRVDKEFLAQLEERLYLADVGTVATTEIVERVRQIFLDKEISGDVEEFVKKQQGSDPASVAHDACEKARARNFDVLIVDTAGRLHTQAHLMRELEKIHRVVSKNLPGAPHEVLLVLDATSGQNAIVQAEYFKKAVHCTGIVLAKLDGTAKGGAIFG